MLDHLSLDVHRGEILGLVGVSGGGKSVLLRTIIGLIPKRQGRIKVMGIDLDAATSGANADSRTAVGRPVPAGCAILVADGSAEHPVSAA